MKALSDQVLGIHVVVSLNRYFSFDLRIFYLTCNNGETHRNKHLKLSLASLYLFIQLHACTSCNHTAGYRIKIKLICRLTKDRYQELISILILIDP